MKYQSFFVLKYIVANEVIVYAIVENVFVCAYEM